LFQAGSDLPEQAWRKGRVYDAKKGHHRAKIDWKIGFERDKVYATNSGAYDTHRHGQLTGAQRLTEQ
jgi:hypothetical protein